MKLQIKYQESHPGFWENKKGNVLQCRPNLGDETLWIIEGTLTIDFESDVCYNDKSGDNDTWAVTPSPKREERLTEQCPELKRMFEAERSKPREIEGVLL